VLFVNWTVTRNDARLKKVIKGSEIEKVLAELNINGDSVAELALFSDGLNSQADNSGMLLRGSYSSQEVVDGLMHKGWAERGSEGAKLNTAPANDSCLTVLNSNLIVFGTRTAVDGAVNAGANSRASFTANKSYEQLTSNLMGRQETYPVLMMLAFPQSAQDKAETVLQVASLLTDLAGVGVLGDLLNKIGYVRGLACAVSRQDDSFPVELVAIMKDESSATFVSGALHLLKGLVGSVPQDNLPPSDREIMQNLKSISIRREREVLSIRLVLNARAFNGHANFYPNKLRSTIKAIFGLN